MPNPLEGMGLDPDDIIRQVGGTWSKHHRTTCGGRAYFMAATGKNIAFCFDCGEGQDDCTCTDDAKDTESA